MRDLPRPAQIYILLVFGLGIVALAFSLYALSFSPVLLFELVGLAAIIGLIDRYPVRLPSNQPRGGMEVTVSIAVKFAAILIAPLPLVIVSIFLGTLLSEIWLRRVWFKLIFNVGAITLQYALVGSIFHAIYRPEAQLFGSLQNLFALAALGASDVIINGILISAVIALASETPMQYVWAQTYKPVLINDLSMLPLGVVIYILWEYNPLSIVLAALPLWSMRHSYDLVAELTRQTREALHALGRVLDERDEGTSQHSELVAEHAGLIARALGLGPEDVDIIMRAAALHDIGKIGMHNDILFKPTGLTQGERDMAKRHAIIGSDLLQKFPFFDRGAIYVRHHHERWDGTGYPDGLRGETIPLGARIIAVADSFQAMIEERPYREPLSVDAAYEQLRAGSGTQFDPKVVDAFLTAKGIKAYQAPQSVQRSSSPALGVTETA